MWLETTILDSAALKHQISARTGGLGCPTPVSCPIQHPPGAGEDHSAKG